MRRAISVASCEVRADAHMQRSSFLPRTLRSTITLRSKTCRSHAFVKYDVPTPTALYVAASTYMSSHMHRSSSFSFLRTSHMQKSRFSSTSRQQVSRAPVCVMLWAVCACRVTVCVVYVVVVVANKDRPWVMRRREEGGGGYQLENMGMFLIRRGGIESIP